VDTLRRIKQDNKTSYNKRVKTVDAKIFEDINNKQAITRSLGYIISIFLFLLGFIMVAFRDDKRSLHDMLAGTFVIYEE